MAGHLEVARSTAFVILAWAVNNACGRDRITLYPVRENPFATETRYPNPSCTRVRRQGPVKTGPIYETVGTPGADTVTRLSWSLRPSLTRGRYLLGLSTAPLGTTPVVTNRHSAIISLRATATMLIRRILPLRAPTRLRNHWLNSLSG